MNTAFNAQYQGNGYLDAPFHDELLDWHDASEHFDAAYGQNYGRGFGKPMKGKGRGGRGGRDREGS